MFLKINECGAIVLLFGTDDPTKIPSDYSCALDLIEEKSKMTLEEIGTIWDISRERIRQIEASALRKLRQERIKREWILR